MPRRAFSVGSYFHIIHRGTRGSLIAQDDHDKWRFIQLLYYFNNKFNNPYWEKDLRAVDTRGYRLPYPENWPPQKPLVSILAYCLMPNHFHLILKEREAGGISTFMHRVARSMTGHFNNKYNERGSLFQGRYKARQIEDDDYLTYLALYIMIKNPCELFPGGLEAAQHNPDVALDFAANYPFSSTGEYFGNRNTPILNKDVLTELSENKNDFRELAKNSLEMLHLYNEQKKELEI